MPELPESGWAFKRIHTEADRAFTTFKPHTIESIRVQDTDEEMVAAFLRPLIIALNDMINEN